MEAIWGVLLYTSNIKTEGPYKTYLRDNKKITGLVSTETVVLHQWRSANLILDSL